MNTQIHNPIHLTPREIQILRLIEEGNPSADAANKLFISPRTVEHHLGRIYSKLNVKNRLQAINVAHRCGFLNTSSTALFD